MMAFSDFLKTIFANSASPGARNELSDLRAKLEALDKSLARIEFDLDGMILDANQQFLTAMGYELPEILGKHHSIFITSEYKRSAEYQDFWHKLRCGDFVSGEFKRLAKGGKEIWIHATYNPVLDENGHIYRFVKFASDITERKVSDANYKSQIDAIGRSQAVIEFLPDGTIIDANENFLAAMGYEIEEIRGKHHGLFVESEYKSSAEYGKFWQSLAAGEFITGEFKRIGKGGKEIWIQASYNPIFDLNGNPYKVVKFATDVTQEKMMQADFSGQIQAIGKSQAVIEFNMDGTIITANDNFLNVMGYSLDEIKGKHHSLFVDPVQRQSHEYLQFWQSLRQGNFSTGEFKRFGKGNKEVWINASYNPILDLNGHPFKVVKYATETTQQKLRTANYEGQINAIGKSQAVIEFNLDGSIIDANENFLTTMGYTREEIIGKHHSLFVDPQEAKGQEYQAFWRDLNNGVFSSGEFRRKNKLGDDVWIQASYNPIFDLNNRPFKVVKFATDITARKKAVNCISESLIALSEGDLTHVIHDDLGEDFRQLKDAMNSTLNELSNLVKSILDSATKVTASANEIRSGTMDLSQRTEEQASSLEQSAASIEQLASAVSQNAESSENATRVAEDTSRIAERGGRVVEGTIQAMGGIEHSSKKIAEIISVVDEIAFQTNLLALNAAVEAARAGDQGRGFSVVASEVRNLAQRSAESAKQIKELINESVQKVTDGTRLVNESGASLSEVVNSIHKVTELIGSINKASQEQRSGINQVNTAVTQMDMMTQQNAALVEQASASTISMSEEARKLQELVQFFKIAD
ncbi:MAG: PAS domain S-box protein [Pseudomonadales bacterium]|nr:PAS domain S-box protein [Pseudomonadales bacterium]